MTDHIPAEATDVVADLGFDNTGSDDITDDLKAAHGTGEDLHFPAGEYLFSGWGGTNSSDNWTWTGPKNQARADRARFVVPAGTGYAAQYLHFLGDAFRVESIDIDLTNSNTHPRILPRGTNWEWIDTEVYGSMNAGVNSDLFAPAAAGSTATGYLEGVRAAGLFDDAGSGETRGIGVWQAHTGDLTVERCHLEGFGANTVHIAPPASDVELRECFLKHTNVGMYINGGDSVHDCVFEQADSPPLSSGGAHTLRGIWINPYQNVSGPVTVEGCDFYMNTPRGHNAVHVGSGVDDITVQDCRIRQERDVNAIWIQSGTGSTDVHDISVIGDAPSAAIRINNRSSPQLSGLCIQKNGNGIRLQSASGASIADSTINVSGTTYTHETPSETNVSYTGGCPSPNLQWDYWEDVDPWEPLAAIDPAPYENTVVVRNPDETGSYTYEIWIDGDLEITDDYSADPDGPTVTELSDGTWHVTGAVADETGRHALRYTGTIRAANTNDESLGQIERNGGTLNLDHYPASYNPDAPAPRDDAPIGWVNVEDPDGEVKHLPVFSVDAVDHPCWRVALPGEKIGAFMIKQRSEANHPDMSLETADGIYAIDDLGHTDPDPDEPTDPDDPDPPVPDDDEWIVDDFEYDDLSDNYRSGTASYQISQQHAARGERSVRHIGESNTGGALVSLPGDGLPVYPERGDTLIFYFWTSHDSRFLNGRVSARLRFGMTGTNDWYAVTYELETNRYHLSENSDDTDWEAFADTGVNGANPILAARRVRCVVEWNEDGSMRARFYDDRNNSALGPWVSGTPQNHEVETGGIAWNSASINDIAFTYYDFLHLPNRRPDSDE